MPVPAQQKKHSVSAKAAVLLIALALLFDGIQAAMNVMHGIPVVGNATATIFTVLVDVWAYLSIWFGFKVAAPDVSFMRPKRALALNGGLLVELIPVLNTLPAWTLAVVIITITTRAEETLAATLEKTAGVMGAAGKMASVASKVPGMSKNMKQGLQKTAEGAKNASQFAREKAQQVRTIVQQKDGAEGGTDRPHTPRPEKAVGETGEKNPTKALAGNARGWAQQDHADSVKRQQEGRAYWGQKNKEEYQKKFGVNYDEQKKALHKEEPAPKRDIGGSPVFHQSAAANGKPTSATASPVLEQKPAQNAPPATGKAAEKQPVVNGTGPAHGGAATAQPQGETVGGAAQAGQVPQNQVPSPVPAPSAAKPSGNAAQNNGPEAAPQSGTAGKAAPASPQTTVEPGSAAKKGGEASADRNGSVQRGDARAQDVSPRGVHPISSAAQTPLGAAPLRGSDARKKAPLSASNSESSQFAGLSSRVGEAQNPLDLNRIREQRKRAIREAVERAVEKAGKEKGSSDETSFGA